MSLLWHCLALAPLPAQLIRDFEDPAEVTKQLELIGYNMGVRLVDEFCAKNRGARCRTFRETIDTVARDGFRMFLGVGAAVDGWNATSTACTLRLAENPLSDFVELPPAYAELRYSSVICGVIRGALDSVRCGGKSALHYDLNESDPPSSPLRDRAALSRRALRLHQRRPQR